MTTVNVASHLAAMAVADPDRPAVYFPRGRRDSPADCEHLTFRQLHDWSDRLARGLEAVGVRRGTRTALMVPPSLDFFALTFALFKVAAVPVLIDPGMGVRNLGICLAEAEPEAFIGVPKAHLARRLLGWGRRTIRTTVAVGGWRFFCDASTGRLAGPGAGAGPYDPPPVAADDTAAVLFTSGSTGVAKGAVYTHGIFSAQADILRRTFGIEPGEVDLCTFPLFALFGPALGMTCVIPDMNPARPAWINPDMVDRTVRAFGVTNLFGSPAVIRAVGGWGVDRKWQKPGAQPPLDADGVRRKDPSRFTTLRRVISAGAPASADEVERFARLIPPGVQVFTPYGATEALPVANIGSREILTETRHDTDRGKGVCVGRPVDGVSVAVIPVSDDPVPSWDDSLCLPPGEIGELVVRGPVVTPGYYNRDRATRLAKIVDLKTGAVLHRMGDVGYLDDRGRLWFCGRKAHRVVTPWGTLFTDQVEPVFNTLGWVTFRTALIGVTRHGVTYPVVCYERGVADFTPDEAAARLRAKAAEFDHTRAIVTFLQYPWPGFPVDTRHNSKIFREKVAAWADKTLGPDWGPDPKSAPVPAGKP